MTRIISPVPASVRADAIGSMSMPDFDNVIGEWWMGDTAALTRTNRVTGALATTIGTPTINTASARIGNEASLGGAAGYRTDIKITGSFTIAMLMKTYTVGFENAIYAYPETDITNFNMATVVSGARKFTCGNGALHGATDQSLLAIPDAANYNFVMGSGVFVAPEPFPDTSTGSTSRIFTVSAGGVATDDGANLYLPTSRLDQFLMLGAYSNAGFTGYADVAAVAVLDAERGQSYAEELYACWKDYATGRGLTVA